MANDLTPKIPPRDARGARAHRRLAQVVLLSLLGTALLVLLILAF
jgi:hypothetical protein